MPALLALVSAAVFGAADFTGGYATRRTSVLTVTLITNLVGGMIALLLVFIVGGNWSAASVGWGAGGGVSGLVGLILLYYGLSSGPNRLVSPLSAVVAAVIPVVVGLAFGERLAVLGYVGLAVAPVAIWLVAGGDRSAVNAAGSNRRALLIATGAGVGFGLFFAALGQTPDDAGAVPLLAARLVSTGALVVAVTVKRPARPSSEALGLSVVAGALDMTANGLFLWAAQDGDLAVVGALVSLFPVTTVLLAIVILHERLNRLQAAGIALAVVSAALLA